MLQLIRLRDSMLREIICRPPTGFSRTFGRQFNAEMSGEDVLKTAQSDRACKGIRINSAKAEVSMLIFRDTIDSILGTKEAPAAGRKKPGWKFW